jgi:hypothetical protein
MQPFLKWQIKRAGLSPKTPLILFLFFLNFISLIVTKPEKAKVSFLFWVGSKNEMIFTESAPSFLFCLGVDTILKTEPIAIAPVWNDLWQLKTLLFDLE